MLIGEKRYTCNNCKGVGHNARACPSKKERVNWGNEGRPYLRAQEGSIVKESPEHRTEKEEVSNKASPIRTIGAGTTSRTLYVPVKTSGIQGSFCIDTGATNSIFSIDS